MKKYILFSIIFISPFAFTKNFDDGYSAGQIGARGIVELVDKVAGDCSQMSEYLDALSSATVSEEEYENESDDFTAGIGFGIQDYLIHAIEAKKDQCLDSYSSSSERRLEIEIKITKKVAEISSLSVCNYEKRTFDEVVTQQYEKKFYGFIIGFKKEYSKICKDTFMENVKVCFSKDKTRKISSEIVNVEKVASHICSEKKKTRFPAVSL